MTINWYGETCFKITASRGKSEQVNLIIDPPTEESGIRGPKLDADILLLTDSKQRAEKGEYFLINMPGEYDVKEIFIQGIQAKNSTIYIIEAEEMRICHLGRFHEIELTPEQLEMVGDVDILMVPIGGNAEMAGKIMSQIEPKITIPMHFEKPDAFLKILGIDKPEKVEKLSIKKKDLPQDEEAKIIVLEP